MNGQTTCISIIMSGHKLYSTCSTESGKLIYLYMYLTGKPIYLVVSRFRFVCDNKLSDLDLFQGTRV